MNHPAIKSKYGHFSVIPKGYYAERKGGGSPAATEHIVHKKYAAVGCARLAIGVLKMQRDRSTNKDYRLWAEDQIGVHASNIEHLTRRVR